MLTDTKIKGAIKSATRETVLNDGSDRRGTGSLTLVIRPGRSPLWVARWQQDGKPARMSLGRYPETGLREAREKFRVEIYDPLLQGRNPKTVVVTEGRPTVARLFAGYLASLEGRDSISVPEIRYVLNRAEKGLGADKLVTDIDPADVSAYLGKIFRRGKRVTAHQTRAFMHAAFNWGLRSTNDYTVEGRRDWGLKSNPVSAVPADHAARKARDRALTAAELKTLWAGVDGPGFSFETACVVRLVICCGQRIRETLRAEGSEIDLDAALWRIPAHKTKVGKFPHVVPLPRQAVEIFRELKRVYGNGPLFPGRYGNTKLLDYKAVSWAVKRWQAGKIEPFQARDLRRTWKTRSHDAGLDPFVRDLIQQHDQTSMSKRHYDRADYLPQMREGMAKWEAWLYANGISEPPALDLAQAA